MNDLQIALIFLGLTFVVAILVFNWIQERKFHRQSENTFDVKYSGDPLHGETEASIRDNDDLSSKNTEIIESSAEWDEKVILQSSNKEESLNGSQLCLKENTGLLSKIEFLIDLVIKANADEKSIRKFILKITEDTLNVKFYSFSVADKDWVVNSNYLFDGGRMRIGLKLLSQAGPVLDNDLEYLVKTVEEHGSEIVFSGEATPKRYAVEQALELKEFCREVGLIIGINVLANTGHLYSGAKIRAMAEKNGLILTKGGGFAFYDDSRQVLFSLDSFGGDSLKIDNYRRLMIPGVTFIIDIPVVSNGLGIFDQVLHMATSFAEELGGSIVDDNKSPLVEAGIHKIRQNLRKIHEKMNQKGIPPGSETAKRIFY